MKCRHRKHRRATRRNSRLSSLRLSRRALRMLAGMLGMSSEIMKSATWPKGVKHVTVHAALPAAYWRVLR